MADKTPDHANIFVALCAAQAEFSPARKSANNPHFKSKYADLASVVDAVRPALTKHGIAFYHAAKRDVEGHQVMVTYLVHGASGSEIECAIPLAIGRSDMQAYKSATTYAKRIGLESVTGVAPEDDDDGNAASEGSPPKRPAQLKREDAWQPFQADVDQAGSVVALEKVKDIWRDKMRADGWPQAWRTSAADYLHAAEKQIKDADQMTDAMMAG